ncbi:MAG: hypothetical protein ABIH41_02480 [Nanoarchaeota archaeon]
MMSRIERKIPGGKLVRLDVGVVDGVVRSVVMTGDFFLHPEDALKDIEDGFVGATTASLAQVARSLEMSLESEGVRCLGFSIADLESMIGEALP